MKTCMSILSLALISTMGCGEATDKDFIESYGRITGELSASTPTHAQNVHVALAWFPQDATMSSTSHAVMISQDVDVSSAFPTQFALELTELPPLETMVTYSPEVVAEFGLDPTNAMALGVILVYEDLNNNGQLDFTDATAAALQDKLLGYPEEKNGKIGASYDVIYWEGPPPPDGFNYGQSDGLQPGFNLRRIEANKDEPWAATYTVLDISTPLTIKLKGDPKLSCYLVEPMPAGLPPDNAVTYPIVPLMPDCIDNLPLPDADVSCIGPVSFYISERSMQTSAAIAQLCGEVKESCVVKAPGVADVMAPLENPPVDWPCIEDAPPSI